MNYTIGRLVQGLASTRQSARHGYFVTLVGILSTFPESHLANQDFHDAVKKRLVMEGSKKVPQCYCLFAPGQQVKLIKSLDDFRKELINKLAKS